PATCVGDSRQGDEGGYERWILFQYEGGKGPGLGVPLCAAASELEQSLPHEPIVAPFGKQSSIACLRRLHIARQKRLLRLRQRVRSTLGEGGRAGSCLPLDDWLRRGGPQGPVLDLDTSFAYLGADDGHRTVGQAPADRRHLSKQKLAQRMERPLGWTE